MKQSSRQGWHRGLRRRFGARAGVHLTIAAALALLLLGTLPAVTSAADVVTVTMKAVTPTVNVGLTATVTATVELNGTPANSAVVTFAVSGAHSKLVPVVPAVNGVATLTYSESTPGTDSIEASAVVSASSGQITQASTSPATVVWSNNALSLTLNPPTQTATPGNSALVEAKVVNSGTTTGVAGITVDYTITGANPQSSSCTTDSSGSCNISYSAQHSGTDTITATIQGTNISTTATVIWPGPGTGTASAVAVAASQPAYLVGDTASVTATVTDANGAAVQDASVSFGVTGPNATTSSSAVNTDANGKATFTYTGSKAGTDQVVAAVGTISSTPINVRWLAGPLKVTFSPATGTAAVGSSATVTVTVTDANNAAVATVPVHFTVTGSNSASGNATTDSDGTASFSYSGTKTGNDSITAFVDLNGNGTLDSGEASATQSIVWSGPPSNNPPPVNQPSAERLAAQPAAAKSGCTYYSATQHNLCAGFRAYWNQFGGLAVYGMPLTEEFQEHGVTVQYFERARFEWHPGAWPSRYDVELGLLGDVVTQGRGSEAPFQRTTANPAADCTYYAATGHNLCGGFRAYWQQFGGLAVYGMPISEEFQEQNPDTGKVYTVQYFERARFEWHPGAWPERYDVELGRLGAQVLKTQYGVTRY